MHATHTQLMASIGPGVYGSQLPLSQIMASISDAEYMLANKRKAAKKTVGLWKL